MTICLPGSSGNLYAEIGGTATGDLDSLNQAINDMQNFDSAAMQQSINTAWGLAYNPFESYYSGSVLDFNDNADNNIAVLNKIAQADTSTGSYSGCSLSESWVPTSTRSPRVIQCKSSATTILTATQCGDTLINTVSCASGCVSAQNSLDSYYAAGNAANAATDITNKYSTCANFKNDLLGL
ncbi:MAG: hypothetical protein E6Q33_01505 [Neisseriales bacterium]|nr:MAG: hypothetical protein E6Q33_01505 [Neisseriales bacterium]